ncbi:endonuclease/exonuclease/phosphatase family protein [Streptomyces boninensis]|uniref:endonuclease/exonuclease/phosphatase family protein n=1 Tax=Streptomyces boninensis TaxID=2039455 RepID=UPI003B2228FE
MTDPATPPARRTRSRRSLLGAAAASALALPLANAPGATAAPSGGSAGGKQLKTMSFNLRYASDTPPNSWPERRPVMRSLLREERPHVLGTQEGLYAQLRDIHTDLGARYDWLGTGRMGGSKDEFMAVFYDTGRLEPVEYDHYWLSDTPYTIASKSWGNEIVRMVTWIRFHDRSRGSDFYFINTHLDHQSQPARERSAELITSRFADLDASLPRVVTGDFNVAAHKNPVYDTMLQAGGLLDTWDEAAKRSKLYGTFHGYKGLVPDGDRIDWILATPGVSCSYSEINTYAEGGQFPSDHLPVQAVLEL